MTSHTKVPYVESYDEESLQTTNTVPFQQEMPNYYSPQKRKIRYGNVYVFFWYKGQPLITLGPHWWLFLFAWLGLVGGGWFLYSALETFGASGLRPYVLGLIIWEGFIFGLTALKNPGIIIPNEEYEPDHEERRTGRVCQKCKVPRNHEISHCPDCNICVRGLDHHCPWTGKCIAKGNLWPFYLFIGSTAIYFFGLMMMLTHNPLIRNT